MTEAFSSIDPYRWLRPPAPTPPEEFCQCAGKPPIKLMSTLGYNPLHCMHCNLEVVPERIKLTESLAMAIAHWQSIFGALDRLWIDSGDYEAWAVMQLSDLSSSINTEGIRLQAELNVLRRCYYWWFQDDSADGYAPPVRCPSCGREFESYPFLDQRVCERCSLVTGASLR